MQEFLLYQDDIVLSSLLLRKNAQPDVTGAKIANNVPIFTHAGDMFRGVLGGVFAIGAVNDASDGTTLKKEILTINQRGPPNCGGPIQYFYSVGSSKPIKKSNPTLI